MITKDNIFYEARRCNLGVLKSNLVDKVKDHDGDTPLHALAYWGCLTREDLRKKYPWYKKEIKEIKEAVDEIVNTPRSIQFILED